MYEIILDQIIDDMQSFGLISTIIITQDYYDTLSYKERIHLEGFLYPEGVKWLILNDERKEYWSFRYSHEPMIVEEKDPFGLD